MAEAAGRDYERDVASQSERAIDEKAQRAREAVEEAEAEELR